MSRAEQVKKMLAANPDDAFLNFALGMEYVKEGRHDDAITQFKRVNTLDPDYVPAYFQQGNVYIAMKDSHAAKEILTQGVAVALNAGDRHAAAQMRDLLAVLNTSRDD